MHLVIEEEKALLKLLTGQELSGQDKEYLGMVMHNMNNRRTIREHMDKQSAANHKKLPSQ